MNNLDSGDISDGMTVEAATDSHLELEGDWGCLNLEEAKIDQENKDQEWDEWDEQGYVMEGEELDVIYGDDELEELEGEELKASLKLAMENQLKRVGQSNEPTPYETIMQGASASEWKKAESKRGLGYSGPPAARTEREHRQKAREAEKINKEIRKG
jgi:hypothetical protein